MQLAICRFYVSFSLVKAHPTDLQQREPVSASAPSKEELDQLYAKLNQCKIKAVALSLIDPFAEQFY